MFAKTLAKGIEFVKIFFFLLWFILRRYQYTENIASNNRMTKDEKLEMI
jgi:hypothetical protein